MFSLKIDGAWEPDDFIQVLQSVESLYYKGVYTQHDFMIGSPWHFYDIYRFEVSRYSDASFQDTLSRINARLLEQARYLATPNVRIIIARIAYASPGGIDLVGIGRVFEAMEHIFSRLLTHFEDRNLRRERAKQAQIETDMKHIGVEKERESLRALQISNAKEFLALRREYPEAESILTSLVVRDQEIITERIAQRKLVGVGRSRTSRT